MDYTAMIAGVNFTTALTAIGTVGAAVATLLIGVRGARIVLAFLKR